MHSELKIGDIVETIKGAKFWGEIIAFDNDVSLPGCMVRAVDPGFEGTKHVYPLTQIARRALPQEPSSASMGVVEALRDLVAAFELRLTPAERRQKTRLPYDAPLSAYDRAVDALASLSQPAKERDGGE